MHKIFISYSRSDYTKVVKLKNELEQLLGSGTCWIDLAGIESDRQFVDVIIDAIDKAEIFLFMYSKHSDRSEWTRKEIEYAYSERKRIVFVKMEDIQLSKYFRFQFGGHDIIDLNDGKQKLKLMNDLAKWCGKRDRFQMTERSERTDWFASGIEWVKNHSVETWLIISACLAVIFFLVGVPLFVGVNYRYRGYLKAQYPQYWNFMQKLKVIIYKVLVVFNTVVSFLFILFAYSEYDKDALIAVWVLLIVSGAYTIYCCCVSSFCGFKTKRTAIVLFGVSAFLYLCSILLLYYHRSMLDARMTRTPLLEQQDTVSFSDSPVEGVEAEIDSVITVRSDSLNVAEGTSMQPYRLHGKIGRQESEIQITVKTRFLEGHIEQTVAHPEMFLSMHLHKKALSGVVENSDGTNIGYVEGLCEIEDSLLCIKGKIVHMDELDSGDYKEYKFSYVGVVSPTVLNGLQ